MNNGKQKTIEIDSLGKKGSGRGLFALYCCTIFLLFLLIGNADIFEVLSKRESKLLSLPGNTLFLEKNDSIVSLAQSNFELSYQNHTLGPFFFSPIAINYCDKILLMSVKGIGPGLAEKIVQTREELGGFTVPEDLLKVAGIGPIRLKRFTPYFSFLN